MLISRAKQEVSTFIRMNIWIISYFSSTETTGAGGVPEFSHWLIQGREEEEEESAVKHVREEEEDEEKVTAHTKRIK